MSDLSEQLRSIADVLDAGYDPHITDEDIAALRKAADELDRLTPPPSR